MAGKPTLHTKNFYRVLSDEDRAILLVAGDGNITTGFHEILRIYAEMHNLGFKRDMSVEEFVLGQSITNDMKVDIDDSGAS